MPRLERRIKNKTATVTVVGQGYVGLPLALTLAHVKYMTYGFDIDSKRISELLRGKSYVSDVSDGKLDQAIRGGFYQPTTDEEVLAQSDVVIICVPTPLRKSKDPDVSYIVDAVTCLSRHLHREMLIILESTTYPGTTDELVAKRFSESGYMMGKDLFVCFSPERVDPGNKTYDTSNTPKVIGGITSECSRLGSLFYSQVMQRVVPVRDARTAEMVKLLENTFRAVNIALVNELAMMCERMGIDIWEAIYAASTKPFGFMPFYPGPGIGGHCIPLDPMYLAWKAKTYDFHSKFIELASDINGNMPRHVVARIAEALNLVHKPINGSEILIIGISYKRDVSDTRESPSVEILRLLQEHGAIVDFYDPLVDSVDGCEGRVVGIDLLDTDMGRYDCVVIGTDHTSFDYDRIVAEAKLIVDTRNALAGIHRDNIVTLGCPTPTIGNRKTLMESQCLVSADS